MMGNKLIPIKTCRDKPYFSDSLDINIVNYFPGNVTGNNSLFTLPDVDYDPSFVPSFFDDISALFGNNTALRESAIKLCGNTTANFTCLFDMSLTADLQAVQNTQTSLQTLETQAKILSKYHYC